MSNAFANQMPRVSEGIGSGRLAPSPSTTARAPSTAAHTSIPNETAAHPEDRSARYASSMPDAPSPAKRHTLSLQSAPPTVPNTGRPYSPPQRGRRR